MLTHGAGPEKEDGSSPEPDFDNHYYFVSPEKERIRIDVFLLPQNATYNPVNRRIRDP